MAKKIFLSIAFVAGLLAGVFTLGAQTNELTCFIYDPDESGMTNIREKPGGKVLFQVPGRDAMVLTVLVQPGGWWRIKDPAEDFGDEYKIPASGAWIHRSVLALGTDNGDGHYRLLRTEPRLDAPRIGFIRQFNALLRPLEMSADGKWVKVSYDPGDFPGHTNGKMTGWIQTVFTREEDIEPGDGLGFPWMYVYAKPDKDVALLSDPDRRKQTCLMEKGKDYSLWVAFPKSDGFWEVLGESLNCGDEEILLDDYSLVPGTAVRMRIISQDSNDVALYREEDPESGIVARLKVGTEVNPLDLTEDRSVWGAEPIMVQVSPVGQSDVTGWVEMFHLSSAPAPYVTYAEVAGTYESFQADGSVDERVVLLEDGHLRWSSGEKTDYLEYPFIIRGFGIYQDVEEVAAGARPDYIFNPVQKNLSLFGTVYYRKN